ncbi:MAG: hypothetical protein J6V44_03740 [Methanobrevibacter sp.]|nr:hypothetical protein [Methanobrevibacter sp.]
MDFEELRTIRRFERNNNSLYPVQDGFNEEIKKFLHPDEKDIRLARSMRLCAKEVLRLRFHKIVHSAMLCAETLSEPNHANQTDSEMKLKNDCIKLFENWCYYEQE